MNTKTFPIIGLLLLLSIASIAQNTKKAYIPYRSGELWGIVAQDKNSIVQPRFEKVYQLRNGYFQVARKEKMGLVDLQDQQVLDCQYDRLLTMPNNIVAETERGTQLLDRQGKTILADYFERISIPHQNDRLVIVTTRSDNCGLFLLDETYTQIEKVLIDTSYGYINLRPNGKIEALTKDEKTLDEYTLADLGAEKTSTSATEEAALTFVDEGANTISESRGAFWVYKLRTTGEGDQGRLLRICELSSRSTNEQKRVDTLAISFKKAVIWANPNFKTSFKTRKDSILWAEQKAAVSKFAVITDEADQQGVLNGDGSFLIPCQYDELIPLFRTSLIRIPYFKVRKGTQWGIVDLNNDTVIPLEMDEIKANKHHSIFQVTKDGKNGILHTLKKPQAYCPPLYKETIKKVDYIDDYLVVELVDENGQFLGYADQFGNRFFED